MLDGSRGGILRGVIAAAGCGATITLANVSSAQTLPGASFYVNAGISTSSGLFDSVAPRSVSYGACITGADSGTTCSAFAAASPSGDDSVGGGATNFGGTGSTSTADFPFMVVGPVGADGLVPLVIAGNATSSVSESGGPAGTEAYSIVQVYNPSGVAVVNFSSCAQLNENINCSLASGQGSFLQTFEIQANAYFASLEFQAGGSAAGGSLSTGFYSAEADPVMYIEPSFLAANPGYSLVFGPGYQPATTIPEPSTWAMLIVGFMGLGFAGWRRGRGRPVIA
jgi:PEP-CTERM motif